MEVFCASRRRNFIALAQNHLHLLLWLKPKRRIKAYFHHPPSKDSVFLYKLFLQNLDFTGWRQAYFDVFGLDSSGRRIKKIQKKGLLGRNGYLLLRKLNQKWMLKLVLKVF